METHPRGPLSSQRLVPSLPRLDSAGSGSNSRPFDARDAHCMSMRERSVRPTGSGKSYPNVEVSRTPQGEWSGISRMDPRSPRNPKSSRKMSLRSPNADTKIAQPSLEVKGGSCAPTPHSKGIRSFLEPVDSSKSPNRCATQAGEARQTRQPESPHRSPHSTRSAWRQHKHHTPTKPVAPVETLELPPRLPPLAAKPSLRNRMKQLVELSIVEVRLGQSHS